VEIQHFPGRRRGAEKCVTASGFADADSSGEEIAQDAFRFRRGLRSPWIAEVRNVEKPLLLPKRT